MILKNKMIGSFFIVFLIILSVFLSGCINTKANVVIFGWHHGNDEATSVFVDVKIISIRTGDNFEVTVFWDTVDHGNNYELYPYQSDTVVPSQYLKIASCLIEDLDRYTTYYAVAIAKCIIDGSISVSGSVIDFIPGTPFVSTSDISEICDYGINWGTLKGDLVHMGGATSCIVWFEYGNSETNLNEKSPEEIMTATGEFSYKLDDLTSCETIYYKAFVSNDIGDSYGFTESFTPGAPVVDSIYPEDVGSTYAVLKGDIKCLGGATSCYVWFEYGRSENNLDLKSSIETVYNTGEISVMVDDLEPSAVYYFRLASDNDICTSNSTILTFETEQP